MVTLVHATIFNNVAEVFGGRNWSVWGEASLWCTQEDRTLTVLIRSQCLKIGFPYPLLSLTAACMYLHGHMGSMIAIPTYSVS